jgi:nucleoid-associated protein
MRSISPLLGTIPKVFFWRPIGATRRTFIIIRNQRPHVRSGADSYHILDLPPTLKCLDGFIPDTEAVVIPDTEVNEGAKGEEMPNNIRHLAVHDLQRGNNGLQVVQGNDALAVNPTTQRIVDALDEMYTKRSSKAHGQFDGDQDNYPASKYFESYLDEDDGNDFADLTHQLMATLLAKARGVPNAGPGHVFFAHIERDARELMLIAIVTEKLSAALTGDFDALDVTHLDLEGFRFAGRIDLSGWQKGDERYVGFLRGRGDVAEYFKEFLGCISSVSDKLSTRQLVTALREYAEDRGMGPEDRNDFMVRARTVLDRGARADEHLDFQALANELAPADPAPLAEFLGDPAKQLGDGFVPNRQVLNTLVKIRYRTPRWSIEIERGAMTDGEVSFNVEENTLTINNLPPDFVAELNAELSDHGED